MLRGSHFACYKIGGYCMTTVFILSEFQAKYRNQNVLYYVLTYKYNKIWPGFKMADANMNTTNNVGRYYICTPKTYYSMYYYIPSLSTNQIQFQFHTIFANCNNFYTNLFKKFTQNPAKSIVTIECKISVCIISLKFNNNCM